MKRVIITTAMLLAVIAVICVHGIKTDKIERSVSDTYDEVLAAADNGDFGRVNELLASVRDTWEENKTWTGMTMNTDDLEEIDISLYQCLKYADIGDKEDFEGEYILFNKRIRHIKYYEDITPESLF